MFKKSSLLLIVLLLGLGACSKQNDPGNDLPSTQPPTILRVLVHDSFAISEDLIKRFESEHQVQLQFLRAGDTGTALNKAILAGSTPLADVFYGVDNTFLSRALEENIFEAYHSPLLAEIPAEFQLDPQARALPVDFGDVCLNVDLAYFEAHALAIPQSLEDLLLPDYKGLLVVENPATSSPGLSFLFATIGRFGTEAYLAYWEELVDNDLLVVNDWETAYYSEFSRWGGSRPMVVSYGSSPAFEVIFADEELASMPTRAILSPGSCFRQIEFVGILRGTPQRALAEAWVDFMLGIHFQEDLPLQMYVFPVNPNAQVAPIFEELLTAPDSPILLTPEDIAEHREEWIAEWTNTVLHR